MCVACDAANLRLEAARALHQTARVAFVHDALPDAFFVPDETPPEMRALLAELETRQ